MRKIALFIAFAAMSLSCMSQNGRLNLMQDSRIDNLIEKQQQLYDIDSTLSGYRVQIFMEVGNDAIEHANTTKEDFEKAYKNIPVYLSYGQPYYRLRVGDFRNRVEAEQCLREIKGKYTNAFVTADNIFPPKPNLTENDNNGNIR